MDLDHLCRVRSCVNPDHLEPVSRAENCQRGANAKLTLEDVAEIRRLLKTTDMTQKAIGNLFAVSQSAIWRINVGKTWK